MFRVDDAVIEGKSQTDDDEKRVGAWVSEWEGTAVVRVISFAASPDPC